MTTPTTDRAAAVAAVADAIRTRQRFVLSSHARPDGDAIGSQLAMAFALDHLGKQVTLVNRDPVPGPLVPFPGTDRIVVADRVDEVFDAAIIMECSSLDRTGVDRLRSVVRDQHRPPSGQHRLRRGELVRPGRGGVRRDGV